MMLFEFFYYIGYSLDKRYKLKRQKHLPYPVISIGNITVGGTGKTPATIAIAEEAKRRGFSPIILTRGYRGKAKGPCFVDVSGVRRQALSVNRITHGSRRAALDASRFYGDEPVLMAELLKDVVIVKCADRYKGGIFFLQNHELTAISHHPLFILDDGFQHRQLHRDVDIVLIDGLNPFGNRKMLPAGLLREPLNELRRAHIYVITKIRNESLLNELKGINPAAPVYFSEYRVNSLRDVADNKYPVDILRDKKVYAFCGIANPDSFRQTVLSVSGELVGFKTYRDHYRYTKASMDYFKKQCRMMGCDFLVTTQKDMVKIRELIPPENLLCVEIGFYVDKEFYDNVLCSMLSAQVLSGI